MFIVSGDTKKAGRNRLLPMAPEFARWLEKVPEADRQGKVFPLTPPEGSRDCGSMRLDTTSKTLGLIGRAAGVVVSRKLRYDAGRQAVGEGKVCLCPRLPANLLLPVGYAGSFFGPKDPGTP